MDVCRFGVCPCCYHSTRFILYGKMHFLAIIQMIFDNSCIFSYLPIEDPVSSLTIIKYF